MTNAPTKDWVDRLLEDVAREVLAEADNVVERLYPNLFAKEFPLALAVLRAKLLPLLLAGQAMREEENSGHLTHTRSCDFDAMDSPGGDCCSCNLDERKKLKRERIDAWDAAVKAASESK